MTPEQRWLLGTYCAFALGGAVIAKWPRSSATPSPDDAAHKLASFIALNVLFLSACFAPKETLALPVLLAAVAGAGGIELWRLPRLPVPGSRAPLLAGLLLVSCAALALLWLHDPGGLACAFVYLAIAAGDAFAQAVGERVGRRPLAPRLSGAKTLEGTVAGATAAGIMGGVMGAGLSIGLAVGALAGVACALLGVVGDLAASSVKRQHGAKTYGTALGPQGGVLDRFDSLLLAPLPVAALLLAGWL